MPTSPRQRKVLAALAAEQGAAFAPVQVQKMFFLLDEQIAGDLGGRQFNFQPYDYGPFDSAVYNELDTLRAQGLVEVRQVAPGAGGRRYALTAAGQVEGAQEFGGLPETAQTYIRDVSQWVRRLSFAQLVGAIYQAYPAMRAKSIFVG